ncbi:MAG: glucose-1-phosphate thymidylyltransferase RfbA [Holosporaceae bacterium]|jgi:glucose-1-phosphate thymidylyltransferase|nr:glucose-1-phosphate thymidylyltransferase RfbA [Holosporaceae bacterium]
MGRYKGILLAGGSGSRMYPLTQVMSKQLLAVYDKPMIYYPLATLMLFGIREILIISTPRDIPHMEQLFGNGERLGLQLSYKVQSHPNGIAEAFILGADFIGDDNVCLILGDNIFYMGDQLNDFSEIISPNAGAVICGYHVPDPEKYGVIEFAENDKVLSIEEKPKLPKSNFAVVGIYFYTSDVVQKAKKLSPSARGELEITDLNNEYLKENRMNVLRMRRGSAWIDAGTPDGLMDAAQFVQLIEKRQGLKISCIEEIALHRGFIDMEQFTNLIVSCKDGSDYKKYLEKIMHEKNFNV